MFILICWLYLRIILDKKIISVLMLLSPIFKGGGQKGDKISKFSETEIFFNYLIFGAKMLNIRKNAIKKGGISTALCGTEDT